MSVSTSPQSTALGRGVAKLLDYAVHYGVEILLIALILYVCLSRGMNVSIDVYEPLEPGAVTVSEAAVGEGWLAGVSDRLESWVGSWSVANETTSSTAMTAAVLTAGGTVAIDSPVAADAGLDDFNDVADSDDPAPHISNLTLVLSPDYGERKGLSTAVITAKKARVQRYLDRYAAIARREMQQYGIPASITLAQGLLESNAGDSKLAVVSKNHFGIKCKKKCLGCTCRNYGDDTRYDMFRVFESAAESFREHSELLNTPRYAKLKQHGTDYVKWAHGLKACGYATDKRYGHKLVKIIENLGLDRYDRG